MNQSKTKINRKDSKYIKSRYLTSYYLNDFSRYKRIDELELIDGKTITATLSPIDMGITDITYDNAQIYVVPPKHENRIDLIAYEFYGSANLYWIICYANAIKDPLDIKAGRPLIIPSFSLVKLPQNPLG